MMKIKLHGIVTESIVEGPGIRYVIFTQGCFHGCEGCHNQSSHDINAGFYKSFDSILSEINSNPLVTGVTFSGGEPMLQAETLSLLCDELKKLGKHLMVYSGFTFEQIKEDSVMLDFLSKCDILVDGKFELSKKNLLLTFRGSENQRIIDIQPSLKEDKLVEIEF